MDGVGWNKTYARLCGTRRQRLSNYTHTSGLQGELPWQERVKWSFLQASRRGARDSSTIAGAANRADVYGSPPTARSGQQTPPQRSGCCYISGCLCAAEGFALRRSRVASATAVSIAPRAAWITRGRCEGAVKFILLWLACG